MRFKNFLNTTTINSAALLQRQLERLVRANANIGFLFLDAALGEYDVEMSVGGIDFRSNSEKTTLKKYQLVELPKRFDELMKINN